MFVETVTLSTMARRLNVPVNVLRSWCHKFGIEIVQGRVDAAAEPKLTKAKDLIRVGKCSIEEVKRLLAENK